MQSKKQVRTILVVLSLGVGYLIWLKLTDLAIPCMFRKVTGWLCPGCGITTLILALTRLDFRGAFRANSFLFVTGPLLLIELGYCSWKQKRGERLPGWNHAVVVIYGIALCLFGVFRNLV